MLADDSLPPSWTSGQQPLQRSRTLNALNTAAKWESYQTAWDATQAERQGHRVIFDRIEIAEDGGLSEIGTKHALWSNMRYLSALITVVFVVYNISFIVSNDLTVIQGTAITHEYFLVSTYLLKTIAPMISEWGIEEQHVNKMNQYASRIIFVVELALLALLLLQILWKLLTILCVGGYSRWCAVADVTFQLIPDTASFSAMKLLNFVTPAVITQDISAVLFYQRVRPFWLTLSLMWLVVSRLFAMSIGLDCFLLKVRASQAFLFATEISSANVMGTVILLNQVLGVVNLRWAVQQRLFRFVFGGEDGIMSRREIVRMHTWRAMVAELIVERYPFHQALTILLTWSDDNFQLLVINDPEPVEEAVEGLSEVALTNTLRSSLV